MPILVVLAGIGQLSLKGNGGDDCIGYTAVASKNQPGQRAVSSPAGRIV